MRPEPRADGTWSVRVDPAWPGFAGHFPGDPMVPAGLIVDWALAVLDRPAVVSRARFTAPVRPGDLVTLKRIGLRIDIACRGAIAATVHVTLSDPPPLR